jgi:RNA polymerase sigma factor (sigma-70 family)
VNDLTDSQLLRVYARERSEAAFAELVRRYVDFVYSAARRMVRDSHLAEDVTQGTFVALAGSAAQLSDCAVLCGWLHRTAQNIAAQAIRTEVRRRAREQDAAVMNEMIPEPSEAAWEQIAPQLDSALGELTETDRDALLLRYFDRKSAREIGAVLGVSDAAAQKRVNRAVERLREIFGERGIAVGAGALVVLLSANAIEAAPATLATSISTAAALSATAVTSAVTVTSTATKTIAMTTIQKIAVTAALTATVGAGIYEAKQASIARAEVKTLQQQQEPVAMEIARLRVEDNQLSNLLARAREQKQLTQAQFNELLKLRGQMNVSRANAAVENDPAFQKAQVWLAREKKIREQFELHPEQKTPEMQFLKEEEWLDHARHADVDTANGMRIALSNIRAAAGGAFAMKLFQALHLYMDANQQQFPNSASQLAGYFHPPLNDPDAILSRYVRATPDPDMITMPMVFEQDRATLVDPIDTRVVIGTNTTIWLPSSKPIPLPDELQSVAKAYVEANSQGFLSVYDLKPYATTPEQKAALDRLIEATTPNR